jgi:quercetin dioxygenase-like cupin family protein
MKHINYLDEVPEKITAAGAKGVTLRTVIGEKEGAPHFDMRIISFEPGGQSPSHSHDFEHEIYVFKGKGSVEVDGKKVDIKPGDVVYVPANADHCFNAQDGMEMV